MLTVILFSWSILPMRAYAHCDGLDGPVVKAAKAALEHSDVSLVLIWVRQEYEPEVRTAFQRTSAVRGLSPEATELADMYFFETVVRLFLQLTERWNQEISSLCLSCLAMD
jgi:hypothetical protein